MKRFKIIKREIKSVNYWDKKKRKNKETHYIYIVGKNAIDGDTIK